MNVDRKCKTNAKNECTLCVVRERIRLRIDTEGVSLIKLIMLRENIFFMQKLEQITDSNSIFKNTVETSKESSRILKHNLEIKLSTFTKKDQHREEPDFPKMA